MTKLLIKLSPKNVQDTPIDGDIQSHLTEFGVEMNDITGIVIINKSDSVITPEGHLLFINPEKKWFAVAFEPDEFVIISEQEE